MVEELIDHIPFDIEQDDNKIMISYDIMIGRYNDLIDFLAKYKIQQFENKHMN
jgi:hypothetical protein